MPPVQPVDPGDVSGLAPNVEITPLPNSRSSLVVFMRGLTLQASCGYTDADFVEFIDQRQLVSREAMAWM